jgi:ubiquinone biosynthesis protein UbiJ
MLDQLANQAATGVLNRLLVREGWAREKLAPFAGRAARFEVPPFALTLTIDEGGLFAARADTEPAVTVGLSLASLPRTLDDPRAVLRDISLKGDAEFAQALAFVLQNLRPEPEEDLARFVGDAAAQRIVGLLRASAAQWRPLAERMLDNAAHYFVGEQAMVVGSDELSTFSADVSRMRDDVARLAKRLDRLKSS